MVHPSVGAESTGLLTSKTGSASWSMGSPPTWACPV